MSQDLSLLFMDRLLIRVFFKTIVNYSWTLDCLSNYEIKTIFFFNNSNWSNPYFILLNKKTHFFGLFNLHDVIINILTK